MATNVAVMSGRIGNILYHEGNVTAAGELLGKLGRADEAGAELKQAVERGERLMAADPTDAEVRRDLGAALAALGRLEAGLGAATGAGVAERRARLARAVELLDRAVGLLGETGTRWGVGTDLEAARKALDGLGAAVAGGTGGGT